MPVAPSIPVIDVDTHVTEPPDLWTTRVPVARYGREVLHVKENASGRGLGWYIGDTKISEAPSGARGAWIRNVQHPPAVPGSFDDIDPGAFQPEARLEWMDLHGIHAQVVYPNVGGFGAGRFLKIEDTGLRLECVRAYNDFLAEWCGAAPERLFGIAALPLWDIDECLRELERAKAMGHRGVLLSNMPETLGLPLLSDEYWEPLWASAEHHEMPVNFHIGSGELATVDAIARTASPRNGQRTNIARQTVLFFMDNARAFTEVIAAGICHRYPKLKLVSVESGIGWVPFVLEAFDWQWKNGGALGEHPEYDLPSDYFRRNWYACFWFERESPRRMLDVIGVDNVLFETDFPHPTSLTPGPLSIARSPREHIADVFDGMPAEVARKVLWENAANLYRIPAPATPGVPA